VSEPLVLWLEENTERVIADAAEALKRGSVIVFPTDTVYGLMAAIDARDAYENIYKMKGRDFAKPLAVLIPTNDPAFDDLKFAAMSLGALEKGSEYYFAFMKGEMTIVVSPIEVQEYSQGMAVLQPGPVAMRAPSNWELQELLSKKIGRVWATSVNRSSESPATTAEEVEAWWEDLQQQGIDPPEIVVLSRTPGSGTPSRVVDLTGDEPKWIR